VRDAHHLAIVITHTGARRGPVELPWLQRLYRIDQSDWIVLSGHGWRALAEGDASIWEALERKLLIGLYVSQPELIAVVGHPPGRPASEAAAQQDVRRIARRVQATLPPAQVMGFWASADGSVEDILIPADPAERDRGELDPVH
jgi:hypothetical protein